MWNRNWVWCPHSRVRSDRFKTCAGSVDKRTWLNVHTRGPACAALVATHTSASTPVNFCLLNDKTTALCRKMDEWRERTRVILCHAAGACPSQHFFYSPTMFNLREQEFVYDSVTRFYEEEMGRQCQTPAKSALKQAQAASNYALLAKCASVKIEPMLVIIELLREGKRTLLLLAYHCVRVGFYMLELLVASTMDMASTAARAATNNFAGTVDKLLREVKALMNVIGDFVEQIQIGRAHV